MTLPFFPPFSAPGILIQTQSHRSYKFALKKYSFNYIKFLSPNGKEYLLPQCSVFSWNSTPMLIGDVIFKFNFL